MAPNHNKSINRGKTRKTSTNSKQNGGIRNNNNNNNSRKTSQNRLKQPSPFTSDPVCAAIRDAITGYGNPQLTVQDAEFRSEHEPVRIFADGVYDMFHSGHVRQLMQAKNIFPNVYLIIGVVNDEVTLQNKGRTVMNEHERYEAVRHCRYVDEVVPDTPWVMTPEFLSEHKIDFVAHDNLPYGNENSDDVYGWLKERGLFVATQRTEGISTTDVIARIIKDYDVYIRRNLSKGCTAKDLNIGFMNEKRIQLEDKILRFRGALADKRDEALARWDELSRYFAAGFMELFTGGGAIRMLRDGKRRVVNAIAQSPASSSDESEKNSSDGKSEQRSHKLKKNGTGSGSLSHSLLRTIAPSGHLYTFDFHEQRVQKARQEFIEHGFEPYVTVKQADACEQGFDLDSIADAVFLDLPKPWDAIKHAKRALKSEGGRICSFSPCIEQVQKVCIELESQGFSDTKTIECLQRNFEVRTSPMVCVDTGGSDKIYDSNQFIGKYETKELLNGKKETKFIHKSATAPCTMAGHTGFLTFSSLYYK